MCYGLFNIGHCCMDMGPGRQDLYTQTVTGVPPDYVSRRSSTRFFTRVCCTNTFKQPDNGWQVEDNFGYEREAPDQHREILQSRAGWGGNVVAQYEVCKPVLQDDIPVFNFDQLTNPTGTHNPDQHIIDSSGLGWTVHSSSNPGFASFDLQRDDQEINLSITNTVPATTGLIAVIFRMSGTTSYLRVAINPNAGANPVVKLQKVDGGTVTDIDSANAASPATWLSAGYEVTIVADGIDVEASVVNGTQSLLVDGTTDKTTGTRCGIYAEHANAGCVFGPTGTGGMTFRDRHEKNFLSFYSAGGEPGQTAQLDDAPLFSGGFDIQAMGTSELLWSNFTNFFALPPEGVGSPVPQPLNLADFRVINSGGTIDAYTSAFTEPYTTYYDYAFFPAVPFGYVTERKRYDTKLGMRPKGPVSRRGWPYAAGWRISDVELIQVPNDTDGIHGNAAWQWISRATHEIVVGPLTLNGDGGASPYISVQEVAKSWISERYLKADGIADTREQQTFSGGSFHDWETPVEEAMRFVHYNYPTTISITDFLSLPDGQAYLVLIAANAQLVNNPGGPTIPFYQSPTGIPSVVKVGGGKADLDPDYNPFSYEVALGEDGEAALAMLELGGAGPSIPTFRIFGNGGTESFSKTLEETPIGQPDPAIVFASDRFWYVISFHMTRDDAAAWATSAPEDWYGTGSDVISTDWMISLDGSIRYPWTGILTEEAGTGGESGMGGRRAMEGAHFAIGDFFCDFDCVKNSDTTDQAPPKADVDFSEL